MMVIFQLELAKSACSKSILLRINKADKSILATDFRSVAFIKHNFVPNNYDNNYKNLVFKNGEEYFLSKNKDLGNNIKTLKMIDKNENLIVSTRNPFNSGGTYSGYLYKISNN